MDHTKEALLLANKLIQEATQKGLTITARQLINQGISPELVEEIYTILERTNFAVDTKIPEYFDKFVQNNIKRCKQTLLGSSEPQPMVSAELKMLVAIPEVTFGNVYDKSRNKCLVQADTGKSVTAKRFFAEQPELMGFVGTTDDGHVEIDEILLTIDPTGVLNISVN